MENGGGRNMFLRFPDRAAIDAFKSRFFLILREHFTVAIAAIGAWGENNRDDAPPYATGRPKAHGLLIPLYRRSPEDLVLLRGLLLLLHGLGNRANITLAWAGAVTSYTVQ